MMRRRLYLKLTPDDIAGQLPRRRIDNSTAAQN